MKKYSTIKNFLGRTRCKKHRCLLTESKNYNEKKVKNGFALNLRFDHLHDSSSFLEQPICVAKYIEQVARSIRIKMPDNFTKSQFTVKAFVTNCFQKKRNNCCIKLSTSIQFYICVNKRICATCALIKRLARIKRSTLRFILLFPTQDYY